MWRYGGIPPEQACLPESVTDDSVHRNSGTAPGLPRAEGRLGDPHLLAARGVGRGAELPPRLLDDPRSDAVARGLTRDRASPLRLSP